MLTRSSWIKIAAIAVLCLCICTGIGSCSLGCTPLVRGCTPAPGFTSWSAESYPNAGNASIPASQVRNIDFDWLAGRIEFNIIDDTAESAVRSESHDVGEHGSQSHEGHSEDAAASNAPEIRLEESAGNRSIDDRWKLRWALEGNTLKVAYCDSSAGLVGCSNLNGPNKTLVVSIPKSACANLGTVSLDAFSGDYNLDGLSCQRLEIDLASGRIDGSDTSFESVDVEVASGTFNLNAQIANDFQLEIASGNADIACVDAAPHAMDVSVASGNVTLVMPSDAGITANVDKMSGRFDFNMPDSHTYDDSFICGDGSCKLNVDMASGNVTVKS